jgi:hypothetical protein
MDCVVRFVMSVFIGWGKVVNVNVLVMVCLCIELWSAPACFAVAKEYRNHTYVGASCVLF